MLTESSFGLKQDQLYMQRALTQARKAYDNNEVPVGAIVVSGDGDIVGQGYNCVERYKTQCAHAEVRAIQQATRRLGDWRLDGHWLYVTLEPCAMCIGLIALSRIEGVVFGAASPLFGYRLDRGSEVPLYKKDTIKIVEGVCADSSAEVLKHFFKQKRKERVRSKKIREN